MAKSIHTLVVDDEDGIRYFVEQTLTRAGHVVTSVDSGEAALAELRDTPFDLAIVDLKLGGRTDGIRILEALSWRWPETVVIILTGHGSLESAQAAIREGVDRYLLKPIQPDELREAVASAFHQKEAQIERIQEEEQQEVLEYGPFYLDLKKHIAEKDGALLDLTPSEFDLLTCLIENAHRVVTPTELVEIVRDYRPDTDHEARQIIKWYIHRLRKKVEVDTSNPRHVINVRGVGYRFAE